MVLGGSKLVVVSAKTPHPETPSCPDGADAAYQQAQGRLRGVDVDTRCGDGYGCWCKPESGEMRDRCVGETVNGLQRGSAESQDPCL